MLPPTGYCIGPDTAHHHMRKSLQNVSRLRCCKLPNPHAEHCMGALRLPTLLLDSLSYYFLPNPSAWLWDLSTTLMCRFHFLWTESSTIRPDANKVAVEKGRPKG